MDILEKLKIMLGLHGYEQDGLLLIILERAKYAVLNKLYPYGDVGAREVPTRYEGVQLNICIYLYNIMGAEGQLQHSENGISRAYESADIPHSMLKSVTPFVGVVS